MFFFEFIYNTRGLPVFLFLAMILCFDLKRDNIPCNLRKSTFGVMRQFTTQLVFFEKSADAAIMKAGMDYFSFSSSSETA